MGGYGSSIQTVINNNKNLLRERGFLNNSSSNTKSKLHFDEVSEKELYQIKLEIQKKAKKERLKSKLISVFVFIICLAISFYFVTKGFINLIPL